MNDTLSLDMDMPQYCPDDADCVDREMKPICEEDQDPEEDECHQPCEEDDSECKAQMEEMKEKIDSGDKVEWADLGIYDCADECGEGRKKKDSKDEKVTYAPDIAEEFEFGMFDDQYEGTTDECKEKGLKMGDDGLQEDDEFLEKMGLCEEMDDEDKEEWESMKSERGEGGEGPPECDEGDDECEV
jgi:hypothetical protein